MAGQNKKIEEFLLTPCFYTLGNKTNNTKAGKTTFVLLSPRAKHKAPPPYNGILAPISPYFKRKNTQNTLYFSFFVLLFVTPTITNNNNISNKN